MKGKQWKGELPSEVKGKSMETDATEAASRSILDKKDFL